MGFGGHFGGHLGYLKMLKDDKVASSRFGIIRSMLPRNHQNILCIPFCKVMWPYRWTITHSTG